MTARGQMLTDQHYRQMIFITFGITILYVLPLFYIAYSSYADSTYKQTIYDDSIGDYRQKNGATDNSHLIALMRFADWLVMVLIRTDMGVVGFCVSLMTQS